MAFAIEFIFILVLIYGAFGLTGVKTAVFVWTTEISLMCCAILGFVLDFAFGFYTKPMAEALIGTSLNGVTEGWQGYSLGMVFLGVSTDIYFALHGLMFKTLFSFTPFCTLFLIMFVFFTISRFKIMFDISSIGSNSSSSVRLDAFEANQAKWSRDSAAAAKRHKREIESRGGVQI